MKPIPRRRWLKEALAWASLPAALAGENAGAEVDFADYHSYQGDIQSANPRVKCYDLRRMRGSVTPNEEFFIFHQTSVPAVDADPWTLEIGGLVEHPAKFTLPELAAIAPAQDLEFTMECSGNVPRDETMNGQVGHARWSGHSLAAVLKKCGVNASAREAVFFGADQVRDSAGVAFGPHARSVFVQDVLEGDALLATQMNGRPLSPEHGFPLRLILPGWYGMAQIKWLSRIEFIDRRYEGPHMSRNYHTLHILPGTAVEPLVVETSISRTRLKSVVARVTRERRGAGWAYRVIGAAWGGAVPIERVEVVVDKGEWRRAQVDERRGKHGWLIWSCDVGELAPGRHTLISRAIDEDGKVQPSPGEWRGAIRSARENNSQWERIIEIRP